MCGSPVCRCTSGVHPPRKLCPWPTLNDINTSQSSLSRSCILNQLLLTNSSYNGCLHLRPRRPRGSHHRDGCKSRLNRRAPLIAGPSAPFQAQHHHQHDAVQALKRSNRRTLPWTQQRHADRCQPGPHRMLELSCHSRVPQRRLGPTRVPRRQACCRSRGRLAHGPVRQGPSPGQR